MFSSLAGGNRHLALWVCKIFFPLILSNSLFSSCEQFLLMHAMNITQQNTPGGTFADLWGSFSNILSCDPSCLGLTGLTAVSSIRRVCQVQSGILSSEQQPGNFSIKLVKQSQNSPHLFPISQGSLPFSVLNILSGLFGVSWEHKSDPYIVWKQRNFLVI